MSFDLPLSIEPRVQEFASAQRISQDEAVLLLIEAGLNAARSQDPNDYDNLFTSEALDHVDSVVSTLEAGESTLSKAQVEVRLSATKTRWLTQNAS